MLQNYSSQNSLSDWNRKWQNEQFVFIVIIYQTPTLEGFLLRCFWNAEESFIMDIIIIIRLCLSYQDLQIHQKEIISLFPVINKHCITGIETGPFAWLFWRSWLKKTAELNQWVERQITWVDPSVAAYKRGEQTALFMINKTNFPNWQNQQNIREIRWLKPGEFIFASVIKKQVYHHTTTGGGGVLVFDRHARARMLTRSHGKVATLPYRKWEWI